MQALPYDWVPFFWTRNFNKSLQYTGSGRGYERIHIDGRVDDLKFLAYYLKGDRVLAAAGLQRSPDLMVLNEAMRLGLMPSASDIESGAATVASIKDSVRAQAGKSCCQRAGRCAP